MIRSILFLAFVFFPSFAQAQDTVSFSDLVHQVRAIAKLSKFNAEDVDTLKARVTALETTSPTAVDTSPTTGGEPQMARDGFHGAFLKALKSEVKNGNISRRKAVRIRVAMISPAFRQQAEDLAVTQMAASGAEGMTLDADGRIDRASIDWEGLISFLERLMPLIMQLIDLFG